MLYFETIVGNDKNINNNDFFLSKYKNSANLAHLLKSVTN